MQSIFEVTHLRPKAFLLDIQCELAHINLLVMTLFHNLYTDRMPPQIGNFISEHVYDNLLKSNPLHKITSQTRACHFVDVADGKGLTPPQGGTSLIVCAILVCSFMNILSAIHIE
jgi:hypothetical protein